MGLRDFSFLLLLGGLALPAQAARISCAIGLDPAKLKQNIQRLAQERGVTIVIDQARPATQQEVAELEDLFGANLLFMTNHSNERAKKIPGVLVFGEGFVNRGLLTADYTLSAGDPRLAQLLYDQKWNEYVYASKVDPNAMAESVNAKDFPENSHRAELWERLAAFATTRSRKIPEELRQVTIRFWQEFLSHVGDEFPDGAYVKYTGEFQSGDRGETVIFPESKAWKLADRFLKNFVDAKVERGYTRFNKSNYMKALTDNVWDKASNIMAALLFAPERIMAQAKMDIVEVNGREVEFRVDFAKGIVFNVSYRDGYPYNPELMEQARKFVERFLKKVPVSQRNISGGADVVLLADGTMKFVEFNFSGESGFIWASQAPIQANQFITNLQGRPTKLIQMLTDVSGWPVAEQRFFLERFALVTNWEDENSIRSIAGIDVCDVVNWLVQRKLDEWRENPTEPGRRVVRAYLKDLVKDLRTKRGYPELQRDLDEIQESANSYLSLHR